jgi:RNA polymerase sigma-70 factor (ECF subfamily)
MERAGLSRIREEEPSLPQGTQTREPVLDLREARLVRSAGEGNVEAFEALYRAHVGRVHAVCRRLLADPGRAEEVTQDVFVRAWQRIGTFGGRSRFSTWLHRIAINCSIDALRGEKRRRTRESEDEAAGDRDGAKHHRSSRPLETRLDLEAAIASLPDGARTVFVLHDVEGYRHGEISRMTGVAEGTSKAQLHRARHLLRGRLA